MPAAIRPRHPRARVTPDRARCHGSPNGGVDGTTRPLGISVERSAPFLVHDRAQPSTDGPRPQRRSASRKSHGAALPFRWKRRCDSLPMPNNQQLPPTDSMRGSLRAGPRGWDAVYTLNRELDRSPWFAAEGLARAELGPIPTSSRPPAGRRSHVARDKCVALGPPARRLGSRACAPAR